MSDPVAVKHMLGNGTQVFNDTEPGQEHQKVIGYVNFPPEKTLAGGNSKMMMIIVPPFTQCYQGKQRIVAAGVGGIITPAAVYMVK